MIDVAPATRDVLLALAGLMVCDVVMGCLIAASKKELSSSVSRAGVTRKAATLILVAVAYIVESYTDMPVGLATAGFFVLSEAISTLENAARLGVPLPPALVAALSKLRSEGEAKPITIAVVSKAAVDETPSVRTGAQATDHQAP